LTNANIYAAAERYDITGLKDLAITKYSNALKGGTSDEELLRSVKEVYESTPANDRGLRDIVAAECARRIINLTKRQEYREICIEIGEFSYDMQKAALELSRDIGERWNVQYANLNHELHLCQRELKETQNEKSSLQRRYDDVDKLFDETIKRIADASYCSNSKCSNDVDGLFVNRRGKYPSEVVDIKCSKCRAKVR
jgi:hypothetical protein